MLKLFSGLPIAVCIAGLAFSSKVAAVEGLDACKIMQKADLETAFAPLKFDNGTLAQSVKGSARLAAVSDCTYTSHGGSIKELLSVSLSVRRAPTDAAGMKPEQARLGAAAFNASVNNVSGLGEGAYWINIGSAKSPSLQLNVFLGQREWRLFSTAGRIDIEKGVANLTQIAKATLTRQ